LAANPPALSDLQAAYDREALRATKLHDPGLKIVGADCSPAEEGSYLCQIGYQKARQTSDRVFLDGALFVRDRRGTWTLINGLCRRAGGPTG
jgi:hypothetical protein